MQYGKVREGIFLSRPNRFIAMVEIDGKAETVHVKNTGRCRELLTPGARVILECAPPDTKRKTKYDIIAVYKGDMLINMDSQSPNKAAMEFIPKLFEGVTYIRPERVYGSSRFDFYIEAGKRKIFMEVKGCTLEEKGICSFPDAPTERGVKHINELIKAASEGYEAYILFVIQMEKALYFTPNDRTHPQFGEALRQAAGQGVKILAYSCNVTENSMSIAEPVRIEL